MKSEKNELHVNKINLLEIHFLFNTATFFFTFNFSREVLNPQNNNPLWYSCLENPMDRKALCQKRSDTTQWLSTHTHMLSLNKNIMPEGAMHTNHDS